MTRIKLRWPDRFIVKLIYRLDKIGIKLHSKSVLILSQKLNGYIGRKYGAPTDRRWMLWLDGIIEF